MREEEEQRKEKTEDIERRTNEKVIRFLKKTIKDDRLNEAREETIETNLMMIESQNSIRYDRFQGRPSLWMTIQG